MMRHIVVAFSLFLSVLSSLWSDVKSQDCGNADSPASIAEQICSNDELSQVCIALRFSGLFDTLDEGGPYTVFVPSNGAIETLSELSPETLNMLVTDSVFVQSLLLYHTTDSNTQSMDLQCDEDLLMLDGGFTTTICDESTGWIYQTGPGNTNDELLPRVVTADIDACNGVYHIIDNVMLPFSLGSDNDEEAESGIDEPTVVADCSPSIVSVACGEDSDVSSTFTILCAALAQTGLDIVLADSSVAPFTVFAPTNEAFLELGQDTIDTLLLEENVDILTDILLYHVVAGFEVLSTDLVCNGRLDMANMEDTKTLCHQRTERIFQVGEGNTYRNLPEIIQPDVVTCDGVIHVIDAVMLPRDAKEESVRPSAATTTKSDKSETSYKSEKSSKSDKSDKSTKSSKSSPTIKKKFKTFKGGKRH